MESLSMEHVHLLANILLPFLPPDSLVSLLKTGVCKDVNANRPRFWLDYTKGWDTTKSSVWMELVAELEGFDVADAVIDIMYIAMVEGYCSADEIDDPYSGYAKITLLQYLGVQSGGCSTTNRTCYLSFQDFGQVDLAFKRRPHLASGLLIRTGIFYEGFNGTLSFLLYMVKILGKFK